MKVLLTGGAGFIGSHLAAHLLDEGHQVVVLDRFDSFLYDRAIKEDNVAGLAGREGFSLVRGDLLDSGLVEATFAARGFDALVHLAALAGVRPSVEQPEQYFRVNVEGTTGLLEACRRHGVRTVVAASSSSVYGDVANPPSREDDLASADAPVSPYAASKRAMELVCRTWVHLHGLSITCLRYHTVYGPRQRPEMAIHLFARRMRAREPIDIYGDGSSGRDYTYVDDAVLGTARALLKTAEEGGRFRLYNLGNSDTVRLSDLVAKLAARLGVEPVVRHRPEQPGDVPLTCADISRALEDLDWRPLVGIDEGLDRFVRWLDRAR
jgi:UDP-glucuronate 4-epimerase